MADDDSCCSCGCLTLVALAGVLMIGGCLDGCKNERVPLPQVIEIRQYYHLDADIAKPYHSETNLIYNGRR